jgi:hypothetical protein
MRTDPITRVGSIAVVTLAVAALAGCGAAVAPAGTAVPRVAASVAPAATARASATADAPPNAMLVVGRRGVTGLAVIEAATGEVAMELPTGAPRPKWDRIVTTTPQGDSTIVRDAIVQPGSGGPEVRLTGHWRSPLVGLDPTPVGRSLDGSTIVLVDGDYDPKARVSRFAVLEHHLDKALVTAGDADLRVARIVELPGAFEYDTLSPDGRILYVVEHLDARAGGAYQVRAVDVPTGVMRDAVIVDKGNPDERMAGSAIAQVRHPDGVVMTLYRGPEHPFIHALNSKDAWALCIDLPAAGADEAAAVDWDLAPSADGSTVYAINASLGVAVDVSRNDLSIRRTATIGTTASATRIEPVFTLAKFGHSDVGPIGRRVVASPDGSMLFAAGRDGVAAIRTSDLGLARRDLGGAAVEALGLTPDGSLLFALLRGTGRIVALDAATGRVLGWVPGEGFDRFVAIGPW